jgi:hypothetical protein
MTFEQVSALNNQLATRFWEEPSDEAEQPWSALFDEVRQLIQDDPERATGLMQQLAHSESRYDREVAARNVDELCTVDVESGSTLWIRLLLDREVSEAAFSAMERGFGAQRYSQRDLAWIIVRLAEHLKGWHHRAEFLSDQRDRG